MVLIHRMNVEYTKLLKIQSGLRDLSHRPIGERRIFSTL